MVSYDNHQVSPRWTDRVHVAETNKRAVLRMKARALVIAYLEGLKGVAREAAQEIDPVTRDVTPRRDNEQDWRGDATSAGLSPQEIESSWRWFRADALEPPPVLEEIDQKIARQTMPAPVRRMIEKNPMWRFVGYDPDLLSDFGLDQPIEEPTPDAVEQLFESDIAHAAGDPRSPETRPALDRLAQLVHLKPVHARDLAETSKTSMEEAKRRLVQEAVLFGVETAKQPVRVGHRTVKEDTAHPIRLEDVFGKEGLSELITLAISSLRDPQTIRTELAAALGGPFRPAFLTDRQVYRNWLRTEIRRQTEHLLGQDLDIEDVTRPGGGRRAFDSYDESEPLPGVSRGELDTARQAHITEQLRYADREEAARTAPQTSDYYSRQSAAAAKKERIELAIAHGIDWQRRLERVRARHRAPELHRYIECVIREPLLYDDDVATAKQLGWSHGKVRDMKRRLKTELTKIEAEARWKLGFPKSL